jgi:glycosyltransferase involved in cell wall biosynthesis
MRGCVDRLNILHVIPAIAPRYGGPSEVVVSLTRALIDAGVDTEIVTTDADGRGRLPVSYGVLTEWNSVPVRFFRRQFGEAFKFSRTLERWLHEEVCRFDVVHIHAVFSHSSVAAFKACVESGVPYVLRPLGSLDPETYAQKSFRKRLFGTVWGNRMLSEASAVHYSTAREQALVEESFGLRRGFVAPAGVKTDTGGYRKPSPDCPRRLGLSDNPYVMFLGRLDPIKQIDLLIDVFENVTADRELARWHLIIAGDGEPDYVCRLHDRASRSSAKDRIKFAGWLSNQEKVEALSGAALLVMLSRHENFGRAAAEAMSLGVPVLISEEVFLADEVREYRAGWVVPGGMESVSRALRDVLMTRQERERRGREAKRLASERFDAKRSTELLMAHYADISGK